MDGRSRQGAVAQWTRGLATVACGAVLATMLGTTSASAAPTLPSDAPSATGVDGSVPVGAATNLAVEPDAAIAPAPVPAVSPAAASGNWVGPWPSTPISASQVPGAMASSAILQTAPIPTTPGEVALVAKSQISLSPTKPQQVSAKALGTAGGRVASRVTTVPDAVETRAGIAEAGTRMVITSDTSKLSEADKQAMVAKAPLLTRALVPVNVAGKVAEGLAFRSTFQTGERLRFEGTVTPKALKQGAVLVIEEAQVAPDGTIGRFFRTHTIKPGKDGKYAQDVTARQGLEVVRHRLLTRETKAAPKVDWAAVKARAEAILDAEEQALLADIAADAKRALSAQEAALLAKLKIAVRTDAKSFVLAHMSLVGTGLITVSIESMSGSRDITINWANQPQDGCNPTTTQDCTMSYVSVPLNSGQTRTVTFVAPTEQNAFGFSADGINGEKYTLNWSLDPNHTTTCAKIAPGPSTLMKLGTSWDIQLQSNVQIEGYLSGPAANEAWSGKYSKDQNKGKTPLGCGFKGTQSFGTWWTNLAGWEKLLIKTLATIAVSMATLGAYDAVVGVEAAADATEAVVDGIEVATDTTDASTAADVVVGEEVDAAAGEVVDGLAEEGFAESEEIQSVVQETGQEVESVQAELDYIGSMGLGKRGKLIFNIVTNRVTAAVFKLAGKTDWTAIPGSGVVNFLGGNFGAGLVLAD